MVQIVLVHVRSSDHAGDLQLPVHCDQVSVAHCAEQTDAFDAPGGENQKMQID